MESIKVTPQDLRKCATEVNRLADDYMTEYRAFLGDVEKFTTTDYTGPDADEFRTVVNEFEPDFSRMKQLMDEYAEYLRQAAQNYEDTSDNAKTQASALRTK